MKDQIKNTLIFFTQNQKLFKQLRSMLKQSAVQRAGSFDEVKGIAKTGGIKGIVLHVIDKNGWMVFDLLTREFPAIPHYAVLSPQMRDKTDALEALDSHAARLITDLNGMDELAAEIEPKKEPKEKPQIEIRTPHLEHVRWDFVRRMEWEIHENRQKGKGDWKEWRPDKMLLISEITWHLAKLCQALERGDKAKISEYSADVANYMMKTDEIYGTDKQV